MKKLGLISTILTAGLVISLGNSVNAEVGYLNYQKILDNYSVAQQAVKEIDSRSLELQQYMVDKEKQYKSLDTPLKKQNFETQTAAEFNAKQEALFKLRSTKEAQILSQVQNAAKAVMVEQKLDAIVADQVIFVGGVDVTDLIIKKLK